MKQNKQVKQQSSHMPAIISDHRRSLLHTNMSPFHFRWQDFISGNWEEHGPQKLRVHLPKTVQFLLHHPFFGTCSATHLLPPPLSICIRALAAWRSSSCSSCGNVPQQDHWAPCKAKLLKICFSQELLYSYCRKDDNSKTFIWTDVKKKFLQAT